MKKLITNQTAGRIELSNNIDIEIDAASWRHVRGTTCISVVLDECAFFRSEAESANRDEDLLSALRPSLVTTNGPMLLISSPGTDTGIVFGIHRQHYGAQGDPLILVCQADSKSLNPKLSQERIDREYLLDPEAAQSEWGGAFRAALSVYLSRTLVERAVKVGQQEWLPEKQYSNGQPITYVAFADMASGDGKDSATLAIAHRQYAESPIIVDTVREVKPPFSSEDVVRQFAEVLKAYNCHGVSGDSWAKGWPRQSFARHGIEYTENAPIKSDIYLHCIALFTADKVVLPDNPRLVSQLCGLRRKIGQGGKETVDHLKNSHDDVANSVCGVLWRLSPVWQSDTVAVKAVVVGAPLVPGYMYDAPHHARMATEYMMSFHVGRNIEHASPARFIHCDW